ncbi:sensor histidine kinase [Chromobacterium aquaticum]|uniref:histidine kinase n=1 Tax=Chromobacterium aquaticum TaxID=467180 RepID=A0ABV8ZW15_9NEIS|nr:ATP-binding protein [Chromobacterium aquaticum]MCD5361078.1 ATP-binding protein [Chromobacterium aquaticum]
MSFKIAARTILHLGAELISSDAVALYELIKNSIDAKSKNGVDVHFNITVRHADFLSVYKQLEASIKAAEEPNVVGALSSGELDQVSLQNFKDLFIGKVTSDAPRELRAKYEAGISAASSHEALLISARQAYSDSSEIVVSDTGDGMSLKDLKDVYLTIGTTNRTRAVRDAIENHVAKPPYLGEKGVGRLSVMRLGWKVKIETAKESDSSTNVLDINWHEFEEAFDDDASSVVLTPYEGGAKAEPSFTRITISDLRATWTAQSLKEIARLQIARMTDPFSWAEPQRFPIRLWFNGAPVDTQRQVAKALLGHAHSTCVGQLTLDGGAPSISLKFTSSLYETKDEPFVFDMTDLMGMAGIRESGLPASTLRTLGTFKFELYWFNRQRLRAFPDVGDITAVRTLVRTWTGVCLFRDGYRVLPYGDEGDDWLGLDIEALGAQGYKLNTKQIIGRVSIGRTNNPELVDQTNRQGLMDTPEKEMLIKLLRNIVSIKWRSFLDSAMVARKAANLTSFDAPAETSAVEKYQSRADQSLQSIRTDFHVDAKLLREVRDAFAEIKDAHRRAIERIETIEEQKERLTQLAGVGLLVETIAHELARATELTQQTLKDLKYQSLDSGSASALNTLAQQIKVIQKRLATLEPLSVTARQRRSRQPLARIVDYVLEGHVAQFSRHRISASRQTQEDDIHAFIIEGHVVQILENLINNSIYWLDIARKESPDLDAKIEVWLTASPPTIHYRDNGPGIPASRIQAVFEPFFSTKSENASRRQGLGLYIARQNAELLGGTLNLSDLGEPRVGRYNTFVLELKEGAE